jgi:hypothetical protein
MECRVARPGDVGKFKDSYSDIIERLITEKLNANLHAQLNNAPGGSF